MRKQLISLVAVLCCVALGSSLRAQASTTFKDSKQPIKYAKKVGDNTRVNRATQAAKPTPEVTLKARPISCATLRQGQPCFLRFSMSWESDQPITACLVSEQTEAGACWEDKLSGEFRKELYLSETTRWDFKTQEDEILGQVQVSVAWVYKSGRVRRNWSLF